MALAFKRIMLITHNVQFAIDTKRALESLGDYEVTTVTTAKLAEERLRNQSHNLILIDIENLKRPAPDVIQAIRKIQKDIAIVLAPDLPDVHDVATIADVQGVVDIPISIRDLIPILEQSVREIFDSLPETAKAPAVDVPHETIYIETLVDELLGDDETPYFTSRQIHAQKRSLVDVYPDSEENSNTIEVLIESDQEGETARYVSTDIGDSSNRSLELFKKLAEEEPPMPNLQESGTVSDLARNISKSDLIPLTITDDDEETEDHEMDVQSDDDEDTVVDAIPAMLVLQTALNETTPIEAISLQTLYDNIQNHLPPEKQAVRPLPSWVKEGEKFIREPNFLPDNLTYIEGQRPLEYTSTTTQPSDGTLLVSDAGNLETEVIESNTAYVPDELSTLLDDTSDEASEDAIEDSQVEIPEEHTVAESEVEEIADEPITVSSPEEIKEELSDEEPIDVADVDESQSIEVETVQQPEDPYVAQLAVTLTQASTDLTAEATILTRENIIVAYSGDMPIEDIDEVRDIIKDDWSANTDNARIRFITLPSSGKDYMLYSKGSVGDFTLSMVFSGTRQLRTIRRQGELLIRALEATETDEPSIFEPTPDTKYDSEEIPVQHDLSEMAFDVGDADSDEAEPVDVGPKSPYTFIWLTQDFEIQLPENVSKKLLFWLEVQLNSLHWTLHKLDVHQDFIYLFADIPGDVSPATLIRNLMERALKIARSEDDSLPENLWADAYLVLTPGRELTNREIQRFLNFARDEG